MTSDLKTCLAIGSIDHIGASHCELKARTGEGDGKAQAVVKADQVKDHGQAMTVVIDWLKEAGFYEAIKGIGHRVVHGGAQFIKPTLIDKAMLAELVKLKPLAPNHLPHEILAIETLAALMPETKQVASFDTAFHRTMPEVALTYPLPEILRRHGIIRYGFHGLSYEYIMSQLESEGAAKGRVIIAHLGHGSSMAAVKDGQSIDTSMGFTPSGGLVMSSRTGDIDPGVIVHLQSELKMTVDEVFTLIYKKAGLLGISGVSADMKEIIERSKTDKNALAAFEVYCYQARKFIGAYAAALSGLDTLVFTAGIGENSPEVRARICDGLSFLGVEIDKGRNASNAGVISIDSSAVKVRVMKTNEELQVATHAYGVICAG